MELYLLGRKYNSSGNLQFQLMFHLRQLHKAMGDGGRHFSGSPRHQQFLASFIPRNGDRFAITGLWEGHITARITITNSNDEHHGTVKMPQKHKQHIWTCKKELPKIYTEVSILTICYYSTNGRGVAKKLGLQDN